MLISCSSKKRSTRANASAIYTSPLFVLSIQYAYRLKTDAIFILSANYGLLSLDASILPYDVTLNKMSMRERKQWAGKVIRQLHHSADLRNDHFIILAGLRYREFLLPHIASYDVPLEGLPIGKQLQWLKKQVSNE